MPDTPPTAADRSPGGGAFAVSPDDGAVIDLRNPGLAAVLAWLVPGLGHLYQGRTAKGSLFMGLLLALLCTGLWLGEGRVVYASWRPGESRLAFVGQAGIGLMAVPAAVQSWRLGGPAHEPAFASPWFAPPLYAGQYVTPRYATRLEHGEPELPDGAFVDNPPLAVATFDQLSLWHQRLGRFFEIGTLYTALAGMLNLLVIYDAWAGPLHDPRRDETEPEA
jgi:hypothetical protein